MTTGAIFNRQQILLEGQTHFDQAYATFLYVPAV